MAMLAARKASGLSLARPAGRRAVLSRRPAVVVQANASGFDRNWLRADPLVLGLGFLGWTIPSNIPSSAFGGNSLFGSLMASIGQELSHWPTGPALTDKFWLYLLTWHVGLFLTLFLGQIGVQGRKQGYFN